VSKILRWQRAAGCPSLTSDEHPNGESPSEPYAAGVERHFPPRRATGPERPPPSRFWWQVCKRDILRSGLPIGSRGHPSPRGTPPPSISATFWQGIPSEAPLSLHIGSGEGRSLN
jgi:hypothetical protein